MMTTRTTLLRATLATTRSSTLERSGSSQLQERSLMRTKRCKGLVEEETGSNCRRTTKKLVSAQAQLC